MAQLFERVDLRGEGEMLKIQQLLEEALNSRLQAAGDELTDQDRQELLTTSAAFMAQLRQFVVVAEQHGDPPSAADTQRTIMTPAAAALSMRSPLLRPLSPPPADAEVQELEAEVTAASLRVGELRTGMQSRLQDMLAAKLAACRPTAELDLEGLVAPADQPHAQQQNGGMSAGQQQQRGEASRDADAAGSDEGQAADQQPQPLESGGVDVPEAADPLSPQPADLQQRLLQAANRMPALRAQLEQAADKLQRVVAAVAADINRPPPSTVEKAVLGKTPGKPAAPADLENQPAVSPLLQQAVASGQISTRRGATHDVQPVPYNTQR